MSITNTQQQIVDIKAIISELYHQWQNEPSITHSAQKYMGYTDALKRLESLEANLHEKILREAYYSEAV